MPQIFELKESLFKGKGTHKRCYLVPDDRTKCIKIPDNKGGFDDLGREIRYLRTIEKSGRDYSMLPKYYGPVETNLGTGYMYEYISDCDGSDCRTLKDYLENENLLSEHYDMILSGLKQFFQDMLASRIVTMGLFPENIIIQKTSSDPLAFKFRMINDMGSASLIPAEYYIPYSAKRRIRKRWARLIEHIAETFSSIQVRRLVQDLQK